MFLRLLLTREDVVRRSVKVELSMRRESGFADRGSKQLNSGSLRDALVKVQFEISIF